ncbi:hypothetical protein FHW04_003833 [Pantoea sp. AN62]|uniref:hypothetical protein n=1 Tax=Pantoea TaxID=53335 RepID=UPI000A25E019|nr:MULTISPECIES: hypothetical protein [Pantoea]MDU4747880.1 hypothetical protein [Pantoea sp.]HCR0227208.1 hypothetical protein [Enterobacter kobei]ORM54103.1 hypothetical protein HA39_17945 [Pantoea brenneri]OXM21237.1 hypothetical protein CBI35_17170 [Pantoea sp. AV62]HCR0505827.1 hypothetical protein [Enterobacter kobei]
MTEHPFTLSRLETALLLVCASMLAASGIYAWLACDLAGPIRGMAYGSDALVLSGLQLYPLLFLFALAGGFGCGALVSITLRRHGFMTDRSFQ